jgi:hypothetical protein
LVGEEEGGEGLWMWLGWVVVGGGWWWFCCADVLLAEASVEEVEMGARVV